MSFFTSYKIVTSPCSQDHPRIIQGDEMVQVKKEWKENDLQYRYGCECLDCIILWWMDLENPVKTLKKEGVYSLLNSLVSKNTISEILYRGTDWKHNNLKINDLIIYDRLTSWSIDENIAQDFTDDEKPLLLKLKCDKTPGIPVFYSRREKEIILGECILKVINKKKYKGITYIEVSVVN
uniref:Uncharacterized protein n=1 Tax=Pithovirus LCPAC001 TaxID=2506585 RepID=A0A481Z269_9VIRU|nr:MAG: hypothetical protein LCPAC001_00340 [Pithovirus LCPAC001]